MIFQRNVPLTLYGITVTISSKGERGTGEQIKYFALGWKYMSLLCISRVLEQKRNLMAHGNARVEKWRGKRRMEGVASTVVHCIRHSLSSITTADLHTLAATSRLNWHPRRYKRTRPFRWKTKSSFCVCAFRFRFCSTPAQQLTSTFPPF